MRPGRIVLLVVAAVILLAIVGLAVSVLLFSAGESGPQIVTTGAARMP